MDTGPSTVRLPFASEDKENRFVHAQCSDPDEGSAEKLRAHQLELETQYDHSNGSEIQRSPPIVDSKGTKNIIY